MGHGDVVRQAQQVFENIGLALKAAGASFRDLVKLNYYFLDIGSSYSPFARCATAFWTTSTLPPRLQSK